MDIIKPETIQKIIEGGENLAKVATGTASQLTAEAINLFIVDACLEILKFSVVFVVFYIVKRYCDAMMGADKKDEKIFKSLKTSAFVLSLVYFTTQSFPHLSTIAKATVAPKIFLMEKTAEFIKR